MPFITLINHKYSVNSDYDSLSKKSTVFVLTEAEGSY